MSLLVDFAIKYVFWGILLLQVEVILAAVAMHAVSEGTQAIAQVFWELMHLWACLGVGCCLRMMGWWVLEGHDQQLEAFLLQLR
jgi:predicted signal transduction protein with EAL and GGDEF domain